MPIAFTCPGCKKELRAYDHLVGRGLKCPYCSRMFTVPAIGGEGRYVESVSNKPPPPRPASLPSPPARAPQAAPPPPPPLPPTLAPSPAAAGPGPAPAGPFDEELVLTSDMVVDAPTESGTAAPGGPPVPLAGSEATAPVAPPGDVVDLELDMIVEEEPAKPAGAAKVAAADNAFSLTDDILDDIIMEESGEKPAKSKKKK